MIETENRSVDDERESVWSVPKRFKTVYFSLFYLLGIIGIGWGIWYEISRFGADRSYQDVVNAVVQKIPALLMGSAFISLVVTEATMVLADMFREYYANRRRKLRAEGMAAGLAEGEAQMNRRWSEWNERRMEAEARGEKFSEPPPGTSAKGGRNGVDNDDDDNKGESLG